MRVHILEDDIGVRDALVVLLDQLGHVATGYPDAESFVACCVPQADDLVVVDLGLPGMSGKQVLRWLSALGHPPRVVAISGQPQSIILDQMSGVTNIPVLRKPLSAEALAELLQADSLV